MKNSFFWSYNDRLQIVFVYGEEFVMCRSDDLRVYMEDIESTLHYSLRHEVALHQTMSTSAVDALKSYITVLSTV